VRRGGLGGIDHRHDMNHHGKDKRESKVKVHKPCRIPSKEYLEAMAESPQKIDKLVMRVLRYYCKEGAGSYRVRGR